MTYIGDFQTKILELPYVGNELSMIILLPDAIQDGTTGLESVSCWAKCKDSLHPSREESLILRTDLQFSSKAIMSLMLNISWNVPHLPAPKVIGMPCMVKLCAAPLARGSGRRPDPPQEQRLAVVMVKA